MKALLAVLTLSFFALPGFAKQGFTSSLDNNPNATLEKYTVGSGSKFVAEIGGASMEVIISIAGKGSNHLSVEYVFNQFSGGKPQPLWQQFKIKNTPGGMKIVNGYVLNNTMTKPERLTGEYLTGYDGGMQMNQFIFTDIKNFKGKYIGQEKVTVPAGTVTAHHFRQNQNGQIIDYWVSDMAKPMGLVKLKSAGKGMDKNYTFSLKSLVKNVKAKIKPSEAVKLSDSTKKWLPKPGKRSNPL